MLARQEGKDLAGTVEVTDFSRDVFVVGWGTKAALKRHCLARTQSPETENTGGPPAVVGLGSSG